MNKTMKKIQLALVAFGVFVVCYNLYEFITKNIQLLRELLSSSNL